LKLAAGLAGCFIAAGEDPRRETKKRTDVMKNFFRPLLGAALLSLSTGTAFGADQPLPGYVDFGKFTPTAGGEFVEVNVNNNLICMAAKFVEKQQPDVAKMLRGIQRVRVNVIGLNDQNRADLQKRVQTIREPSTSKAGSASSRPCRPRKMWAFISRPAARRPWKDWPWPSSRPGKRFS